VEWRANQIFVDSSHEGLLVVTFFFQKVIKFEVLLHFICPLAKLNVLPMQLDAIESKMTFIAQLIDFLQAVIE